MEMIQRGLLWGDNEESHKSHLIGWGICCLSNNDGGLGITSPHLMNELAFLLKIIWNMINNPYDLCFQVLYSKYGRNKDLRMKMTPQPYDFTLWKALKCFWEKFQNHIVLQLGDGNKINFWMDKWTSSDSPLILNATNSIIDTTFLVKDILKDEGQWDLNFLYNNLNFNKMSQIMAISAPIANDEVDTIGWKGTNIGQFIVQSAYNLQLGNDNHVNRD